MNQVTEMFRLNDTSRTDEALARLSGLLDVMALQHGFLHAEVTRDVSDDNTLLVFHAWSHLEDWQAFQTSQWKLDFMARRPEGLYSPVPIGMNWTLLSGEESPPCGYVRREVSLSERDTSAGQVFREAMADACEAPRWMTLEYSEAPSDEDGWFKLLLTRSRDAVGAKT